MRLSVQMIGVLAGILFIGEVGNFLLRARSGGDDRRSGGGIVFVGAALLIIGYAGLFFGRLIKAAVSRQREFLADASSVQFTRNPEGIAGALATISAGPGSPLVANRRAKRLSHMFFATGVSMWFESLFATHPPLLERIARIDRRFNPIEYLKQRRPRAAEPPESVAPVAPTARPAPLPAAVAPLAAAPAPAARAARVAGVLDSVGRVTPSHVQYASAVLENLPAAVNEAVADAEGAGALVLALALSDDELARKQQLALLEAAGADALAAGARRQRRHRGGVRPRHERAGSAGRAAAAARGDGARDGGRGARPARHARAVREGPPARGVRGDRDRGRDGVGRRAGDAARGGGGARLPGPADPGALRYHAA